MKNKVISITRRRAEKTLFKLLIGRVFHITSFDSMLEIFKTGFIKNNRDKGLKLNWSSNSYFTNRGYVSVCDLFNNSKSRKIREAALSTYQIFGQNWGPNTAFLFLNQASYSKLVTWEQVESNKNDSYEIIVPYLESGYPDQIPLKEISEIWVVNISDYINYSDIFFENRTIIND